MVKWATRYTLWQRNSNYTCTFTTHINT